MEIGGSLTGGHTSIECFTSQYLSSLLLCTPLAPKDTVIDVTLLNEPDYVKMTCDWLDKQGIKYSNENMKRFEIKGGQSYKSFDLPIPADFSSATFFMCAAAILKGDVTLTGLDFNDSQPDKAVADYLKAMGAQIKISGSSVRIKGGSLKGIEIDMNKTPDALPAMAVTAAFAEGETRLVNVPQARSKETDRIACMAQELKKMGADIEELPDGLIIRQQQTARRSRKRPRRSPYRNGAFTCRNGSRWPNYHRHRRSNARYLPDICRFNALARCRYAVGLILPN